MSPPRSAPRDNAASDSTLLDRRNAGHGSGRSSVAMIIARILDVQAPSSPPPADSGKRERSSPLPRRGRSESRRRAIRTSSTAAMDWLLKRQATHRATVGQTAPRKNGSLVLVRRDFGLAIWRATKCALARRGYSKRRQAGQALQIVFAPALRPGRMPGRGGGLRGLDADPKTVACQVEKLRTRFWLAAGGAGGRPGHADRGAHPRGPGGRRRSALDHHAARADDPKLLAAGTVTPSMFDERDLAEVTSELYPGERLIVCRNPLLAARAAAQAAGAAGGHRARTWRPSRQRQRAQNRLLRGARPRSVCASGR